MTGSLHDDPPATPSGVLLRRPRILAAIIAAALSLAVLAALDGGSVLLTWDEPIQRWVEGHRTGTFDTVFRSFSRLGSTVVVFATLGVLLLLLARRCPVLALVLALAVLARPLIEFGLKELVDRPRPELDPLVPGVGPSHPSGHVLAAMVLWGLLPPIVATLTNSRTSWWISVWTSSILVVGIAASRVYLGVHWFSDVIAGVLVGILFLLVIEWALKHLHRNRGCSLTPPDKRRGESQPAASDTSTGAPSR